MIFCYEKRKGEPEGIDLREVFKFTGIVLALPGVLPTLSQDQKWVPQAQARGLLRGPVEGKSGELEL